MVDEIILEFENHMSNMSKEIEDLKKEKLIGAGGMGIVDPQKIYNTLEKYLENAGYKDASQFFNNPSITPPPPPKPQQPDPSVQLAMAEQQRLRARDQADMQLKARKQQADEQYKLEKINLDQQKLATQVVKESNSKNLEKEKLASKIIQQGIN